MGASTQPCEPGTQLLLHKNPGAAGLCPVNPGLEVCLCLEVRTDVPLKSSAGKGQGILRSSGQGPCALLDKEF